MHDLLQTLSDLGRNLTSWCITTNLNTFTLLAIALAADLLIARRLSPAWRIALYLPVVLRVLIPPHATWSVPFWQLASPAFTVEQGIADSAAAPAGDLVSQTVRITPISLWPLAIYFAGVAILIANWFRSAHALRRVVEASRASHQVPTVLISPNAGPMVAGIRNPRIIIPAWLIRSEALPLILAHERAHIARRDPAFAFALRTVCTLAWPILPLWIAASRIRALMEHACDDHALGAPSVRRQENIMKYARAMIDVAQRSTHFPGSLAFGAALRPRIKALRATRRWPAAIQIGIALALPTLLLACSAARPQSEPVTLAPAMLSPTTLAPTMPTVKPFNETEVLSSTDLNAKRELQSNAQVDSQANQEARVVNVTIVTGDAPWPSEQVDKWNPRIDATDSDSTNDQFTWIQYTRFETAPRLLVTVGQPAAVRTDIDRRPVSLQITVLPSDAGTVLATMSYSEGDLYKLDAATLKLNKGQSSIIRIPSAQMGLPTRTLIINISRPGEEPGC